MFDRFFLSLVLCLGVAGQVEAQTALCTDGFVDETWNRALDAYEGDDNARAETEIGALIVACEADPITFVPRILGAELALESNNIEGAANLLAPIPDIYDFSLGAHAGWLRMLVYMQMGDEALFNNVRAELLSASHDFLSDPDGQAKGRHIETWETDEARISAYETQLVQRSFFRRYIFLIEPKSFSLPESVMITQSAATSLMADLGLDSESDAEAPTPLAVDGYSCSQHLTLNWIDSELDSNGPTVSYETAKGALAFGVDDDGALLGTQRSGASCAFSGYITPVEQQ